MNQKLVKRIRRNNRIKYPNLNNDENYERDVRRVSKEDRKLLVGKPTSPNPVKFSKRQERLKKINKLHRSGFPKLNVQFLLPVTFMIKGKRYRGRYGLKVISKSLENKINK